MADPRPDIAITTGFTSRLIDAAYEGSDPLGLVRRLVGEKFGDPSETARRSVRNAAVRALTAPDQAMRDRFAELMLRSLRRDTALDGGAAALMESFGLDPVVLLGMTALHPSLHLASAPKAGDWIVDFSLDAADGAEMRIWHGPVCWRTGGTIRVALPETLAQAAIGRPLRDVVSHPSLDALDLHVTGVAREDPAAVVLELLGPATRRLAIDEVIAGEARIRKDRP